jgi:GTPase involved in cell partitioning and DNA repair
MAFPRAAGGVGKGGPNGGSGYRGRGGQCGCQSSCGYGDLHTYNYVYYYDDYCDSAYNQWGPATGNDMWGTL